MLIFNWGNFSKVAFFCHMRDFFAVQRGGPWSNGKYATAHLYYNFAPIDEDQRTYKYSSHWMLLL